MVNIIINADDFGHSVSVNDAIIKAFENNLITSTTLMVNMPGVDDAVKRAKDLGLWDRVGLHINLFEGEPLNPRLKESSLITDGAKMKYWAHGRARLFLSNAISKEIEAEIKLQVEKFMSYSPVYMHADSHGHSHTNRSVWKFCKGILLANGFSSTRLSRNLYTSSGLSLRELYKWMYNNDIKKSFKISSNYFGSFSDFKAVVDENSVEFGDGDIIELMCHPVISQGDLINSGNLHFNEFIEYLKHYNKITF